MTSFYNNEELKLLGFKSIGKNVLISKKASFYGNSRISIGNNVRIDDFCVISAGKGGIKLGNYIHIAVFTSLIGESLITLEDFTGLSSKVSIYSSSDDYTGEFMTNPMVPQKYTGATNDAVLIKKHVIIGSGSVVLPGITINEGVAVGALSLVNIDCESFFIYSGHPIKKLCNRNKNLLELEQKFLNEGNE